MAHRDGPEGKRTYGEFGWHGITLTVPSHWELIFTEGRRESGYVRLADDEAVRMELRWQSSRQARPPAGVVDAYLGALRKRARKQGLEFSVQRELNLASPPGKEVECYRWVADRQSVAMASRCAECDRAVHVHLLGDPHEGLKALARTVFASLQDHPPDGWDRWSFFDVRFHSPSELPLIGSGLEPGRIRMAFGRGLTRLRFIRLSLAQVLLAGKGLRGWLLDFYGDRLKRRSFDLEPTRIKDHPGLMLRGRPWLLVNPLRLLGRARVARTACWHCEPTNRLFVCGYDGPGADAGVFERALESFACCESDGGPAAVDAGSAGT